MFGWQSIRTPQGILVCGWLVAIAVTCGAGFLVLRLHEESILKTEVAVQSTAVAIGEQTDRAFESVATVQSFISERLEGEIARSGSTIQDTSSGLSVQELLKQQVAALPHVSTIAIIDAQGKPVAVSWAWRMSPPNYSDRDYVTAFQSDASLISFVGEPVLSKYNRRWIVPIARRVRGNDGALAGLVVTTVDLEYLLQFYEAVASRSGSAITLFRRDGMLLARYPRLDLVVAKSSFSLSQPTINVLATKKQGVVHQVSSLDGRMRIIGLKALSGFPVAVAASTPTEVALAGWHWEASIVGILVLLIDATIALACWSAFRQLSASARLAAVERHLARHDPLTGLANRVLLLEEMERSLSRPARRGSTAAILLLDLDGFKAVNDCHGHQAGDEVLKTVAARLQSMVRTSDVVARLGGDEFAVMQRNIRSPDDAANLASRLLAAISEPVQLREGAVSVRLSIGAALAPDNAKDPSQLLKCADLALYEAKGHGKGTFRFFDPEMERGLEERLERERDVRRGIAAGEFEPYYQPLLDLRTDSIAGFEALVRWRHPERGVLLPDEFIPFAEATGLIKPLGDLVLRQACRDAASWPAPLKVAVNLSGVQFKSDDLFQGVTGALDAAGLPGHRLEIEITETVLLESRGAAAVLRQMEEAGITIALDDFGTGYASLIYLRKFPFRKLKIDRSFISDAHRSLDADSLLRGILDLSRRLNLRTVAEGVETEEQLSVVRDAGCAQAQGYLIGRPMPAGKIPSFLASRAKSADKVIHLIYNDKVVPAGPRG